MVLCLFCRKRNLTSKENKLNYNYLETLQKNAEIFFLQLMPWSLSSSFDRIPNSFKEVSENQKLEIDKLLEKIENDDDVQNVFHNMK